MGPNSCVGLNGTPTITFGSNVTLFATEWATDANGFGVMASGTFRTAAEIDAGAQAFDQSAFSTPLPTTLNNGTARDARHSTRGEYLFTRPAGVAAVALTVH